MDIIEKLYELNKVNSWFKPKHIQMYKDFVFRAAQESSAIRRRAGALVMSEHGSLFLGYNGTPPGESNVCEDDSFVTLPSVTHAEMNCLKKMENEKVSLKNGIIIITDSPCEPCCEKIIANDIKAVIYFRKYRICDHLHKLEDNGIMCIQIDEDILEQIRLHEIERKKS